MQSMKHKECISNCELALNIDVPRHVPLPTPHHIVLVLFIFIYSFDTGTCITVSVFLLTYVFSNLHMNEHNTHT